VVQIMTEQSTKETIQNTTLHVLVRQIGLTPQQVAQLRLSDLHLAGKSPNVTLKPEGNDEPKTVKLDLEAHRALVGWLVARPDSISDFLFPGQGGEAMDWQEIQKRVELAETTQKTAPAKKPLDSDEKITGIPAEKSPSASKTPATGARPKPPPSTPELGAPPPGLESARASIFQPPPPTAPEQDEPVSIPLPSSAPKPPPTRPPQPVPMPVKREKGRLESPPPVEAATPSSAWDKKKPIRADSSQARMRREPAKKKDKPTALEATTEQANSLGRFIVPVGAIVMILLCAVCAGGGWFAWQSDTGQEILAGLNLLDASSGTFPEEIDIIASLTPPIHSPPPTPTLPPTSTPTFLPPTNTPPPPTETATPVPTDTPPPPPPTDTLVPVDTPVPAPTDTFTPAPPAETPTPTDTPTPAMKYGAPVLLEPEDGAKFIEGNIVTLRWQSVGELAPDEQYAVRLIYSFQQETTFQGSNLRETEWTIPVSLYGQVDGPENLYEWFVVVERLNDDGSGTTISPESERRTFTWK
jgi:hypothetical protein